MPPSTKTITAVVETSLGNFTIQFYPENAPKTVDNFVGLAKGTKEFTDPKTGSKVKRPFYDGLTFHRIVPGFVIQGGDPEGSGRGGPGYQFEDELTSVKFTKAGLVAMANAGPNTNGSQFFVTLAPLPTLPNAYTIFGEVTDGLDVVQKIGKVQRDGNDMPITPVKIIKVTVK